MPQVVDADDDVTAIPEQRALVPALEPGRWVGEDPVYDRKR